MADLKFDVDSSEVSRAVDELIRMGKASKDTAKAFEQGFRKVVSWQEKFKTEQGRINATLEKNYRAQTLSNKSAKESAAVFQQLEAEVSKAATSYSQLKASIDPVYAAQLRMKKGHEAVRAALKAGVITRAEAAQSLRAYRAEVKSLSQAQMAATKSSNRFGVVTQQAGYQIGDFLVQVQSGTNPMVAFGQQATQLVGILPLMTGAFGLSTTALIGLSAGLGIAIPLVTAIGAAFMRAKEGAEGAAISLKSFEENLKSAKEEVLSTQQALDIMRGGFEGISDFTLDQQIRKARAEVQSLEADLNSAFEDATQAYGNMSEEVLSGIRDQIMAGSPLLQQKRDAVEAARQELAYYEALKTQQEQLKRDESVRNQLYEARQILAEKAKAAAEEGAQARLDKALAWFDGEMTMLTEGYKITRQEAELLNDAAAELGERLGVSFMTALNLIRQAKAEATVGLDAFGGAGDFKYSSAETIKPPKIPSSGGGSKTTPKDPLAELLKRITLDEKLLGVSKERETVLRAIANSDKEYSDAAINGAISRLEAYNKEKELLEEVAAQQQNIADTLKNSMEDAFMSMVDGTKSAKDAFKDMARAIISELYKVLVVQQMVGSFDAKTGEGSGIVGAIMGAIGQRASGGTVLPNQPYLVGEKGPELIMPQNRGHVMNADLTAKAMGGSGEAVVVNQTFNFSANGDDSVKRIIAQEAPKIANLTQKQILDQRARGGAFRTTFGA